MKFNLRYILVLIVLSLIFGCVKPRPYKYPSVTNGWRHSSSVRFYRVQPKDTLYSIAWAFDMDFRDLAELNNLQSPYRIKVGQKLLFSKIADVRRGAAKPRAKLKPKTIKSCIDNTPLKSWQWPVVGKIVTSFNEATANKGIDIAGKLGEPILSANDGEVVYSGTGLRSYGKLIIIKHNDDYLSAYAFNREILVKEGQSIKRGQKVGTMGYNNDRKPCLHFEIRRFGKPVDPLLFLPKK